MGKIAVVFAGQGAQYTGMGQEIYNCSKSAKDLFDRAEIYRKGTILQCFNGDKALLGKTINTQPTLYLVSLGCYYAFFEAGLRADCCAGFSLGEIPALAACGLLDDMSAFKLVMARAEFMEKCTGNGGMYAILGISAEKVEEIVGQFDGVYCVNYNCDTQTVISGGVNLDSAVDSLKSGGARALKLDVSGAFHSPYMDEASANMNEYLDIIELKSMNIPIYSNVTAEIYNEPIKEKIYRQINSPVKWSQIIRNMALDGVDKFVEVGAGKVLSGLIKKIIPTADTYNIMDEASLELTVSKLK